MPLDTFMGIAGNLEREVSRLIAEKRALETKIEALKQTHDELTARVGDHMKNLEVKKQVEDLQLRVRNWLKS